MPVAVIVKIPAPTLAPRFLIVGRMRDTIPQYAAIPGLDYKIYTLARAEKQFGGVYLWQDRQAAAAWFNDAWFERVRKERDAQAELRTLEVPVAIDNQVAGAPPPGADTVATYVSLPVPPGETLRSGIEFGRGSWDGGPSPTPQDKAAAREMAVSCTQAMLMRLDRPHRLAYILDVNFSLPSHRATQVLQIEPAAYRQRLSRPRRALEQFSRSAFGLVSAEAECRCERQVHTQQLRRRQGAARVPDLRLEVAERQAASAVLDQVLAMSDIAAVLRAHPQYRAPQAMIAAIRRVVAQHDPPSPRLN